MSIGYAVDDDCNNFIACLGFTIYPAYGTHNADDLVYLSSTALPNVVFPSASRDSIPTTIFTLRRLGYSMATKQRSSRPSWGLLAFTKPRKG